MCAQTCCAPTANSRSSIKTHTVFAFAIRSFTTLVHPTITVNTMNMHNATNAASRQTMVRCARSGAHTCSVVTPTQRQACPIGMRPFAHPRTHQPIVCQPGADGFCPYASLCQYSSVYWQFICCQPDSQRRNSAMLTNDAVNEQSVGTDSSDTSIDHQHPFTAFVGPAVGLFDKHTPAPFTVPQCRSTCTRNAHPLSVIYPGEPGCRNDEQCSLTYPGAHCHDWVCACPIHMFVFERSCCMLCKCTHSALATHRLRLSIGHGAARMAMHSIMNALSVHHHSGIDKNHACVFTFHTGHSY
jgi:hypothetical protein